MSILQDQRGLKVQRWIAYTPTVAAGTGTFTSVAATGRYFRIGKIIFLQIQVVITTNGTAATNVSPTLPVTSAAFGYVIAGRNITTGLMLQGTIPPSSGAVAIINYDGTYPGADGYTLRVSGIYEAA